MKKCCSLTFLFLFSTLAYPQSVEKTVSIAQPKERASRYYYVPFEVPAGVTSLTLAYAYDRKGGANVLDLGLFDPNFDGTESNVKGFRGWSGGRRDTIFVGKDAATNGYLAGEIPKGTWRVVLGLYQVVPEGVDVTVKIRLNEIEKNAELQRNAERAKTLEFSGRNRSVPFEADGLRWFRGDLHMHTFHSDGRWNLKGLLDFANANDLDFIGVTEHNTFAHHAELRGLVGNYPDLLVMRGEEVTTYGGHFNVWGLPFNTLIDFRVTPGDAKRLDQVISTVHGLGLLASINHPFALCGGCSWSYGDDWAPMDSVEVWNGFWDPMDEASLQKWDALLQKGSRITAIGSSDSHTPPPSDRDPSIGQPTTFAGAKKLTEANLLDALKAHRIFIAENPRQFISLSAGSVGIGAEKAVKRGEPVKFTLIADNFPQGAAVRLISDGKTLFERSVDAENLRAEFTGNFEKNSYARLEIRDANNKPLALSNPIFLRISE